MRIAMAGLSLALVLAFAGVAQASPPDIAAFLDRSVSAPQLSPSGRYLAYDLTEGGIDQLVITDLDGGTSNILFKTKAATKELADKDARQAIIGIQWKSDDYLIVSIVVPETTMRDDELYDFPVVNLVTTRDGSKSITLNGKVRGSRVLVNGSAILDTLPDDPTHLLAELRDDDGNLSVYRVDVRDGTRQQIERGGPRVIGYGTNRKGEVVTRIKSAGTSARALISNAFTILEARAPGESDWSKLFEVHLEGVPRVRGCRILSRPRTTPRKSWCWLIPTAVRATPAPCACSMWTPRPLGPVIFNTKTFDVDSVILNTRSRE